MTELPFGFDTPQDSPGFLLWQTTITWQRLIKKALEAHNISHAQFVIIALLLWFKSNNYKPTQILIINYSKLDKMTVSKSLKKLVALGLVNRIEHETDSRAKSISLTLNGENLVHKLVPIIEQIDLDFFGKILKSEQQTFINILKKLIVSTI